MRLTSPTSLLSASLLLPSALAASRCTADSAVPIDISPQASSSSGSGSICGGNPICIDAINQGMANAGGYLKGRSSSIGPRTTGSVSCTASQKCISLYNSRNTASGSLLMCIDLTTGEFVDEEGESGNLLTGVFTDASGHATTVGVASASGGALSTAVAAGATPIPTSPTRSTSGAASATRTTGSGVGLAAVPMSVRSVVAALVVVFGT